MGDKRTPAQMRAMELMSDRSDWPLSAGVRVDVLTALIRKGIWENFSPSPTYMARLRWTPAGIAAIERQKETK